VREGCGILEAGKKKNLCWVGGGQSLTERVCAPAPATQPPQSDPIFRFLLFNAYP
jgi:hypothetical protein